MYQSKSKRYFPRKYNKVKYSSTVLESQLPHGDLHRSASVDMASSKCRCGSWRLAATFKFLMAFCMGFAVRSFLDMSLHPACPDIHPFSPPLPENELLKVDFQQQLREPFRPSTLYEVIRYDYFNMSTIFNNFDDDPKTGLLAHQKADIKDIVYQAMALYNSGRQTKWKMLKLLNGYRRYDPLRGEEFVLDVHLQPENEDKQLELHRMELVKPVSIAQLLQSRRVEDIKMIHFILPAKANSRQLQKFLRNYEEVCLRAQERVYLMVMLFVGDSDADPTAVDKIRNNISQLSRKYRKSHMRVVTTRKEFSRPLGLDLGLKQLPQDALVFFADVDVKFSANFLHRCRTNAVLGKQVYYPIVFAQYDPEIVKKYSPAEKTVNMEAINKYTGHWVHDSFSLACLHVLDYRLVGGFNGQTTGWGAHELNLYLKHVKSNFKVFRAADPDLVHIYQNKSCSSKLPETLQRVCLDSLSENLGSRQELGRMIIDHKLLSTQPQ